MSIAAHLGLELLLLALLFGGGGAHHLELYCLWSQLWCAHSTEASVALEGAGCASKAARAYALHLQVNTDTTPQRAASLVLCYGCNTVVQPAAAAALTLVLVHVGGGGIGVAGRSRSCLAIVSSAGLAGCHSWHCVCCCYEGEGVWLAAVG